jgi:plastocyanin
MLHPPKHARDGDGEVSTLVKRLGMVGIVVALASVGIACSSSDNGGTVNTPSASASTPAAGACSTPSPEAPVNVKATDSLKFDPPNITVKTCQLVIWTVTGSLPHTVTATSGANFDSGTKQRLETYTQGFPTAGTIHYYCKIHGASMSGTITVTS